jgi:lysophospholipase L1-like esterase
MARSIDRSRVSTKSWRRIAHTTHMIPDVHASFPPVNVLCFGDSIVYGEVDEVGGGWVSRLKAECLRRIALGRAPEVQVHNLGLCGETTRGLRQRFEGELAPRVAAGGNDLVLLACGTNDAVQRDGAPLVPLEEFRANLAHCILAARGRGLRVALVTVTPIAPEQEGRPNANGSVRSAATIVRYNATLAALAADTGAHLVDVHAPLARSAPGWLRPDGVHPNHEGHRRLFELVLPEVDRLVGVSARRNTGSGLKA